MQSITSLCPVLLAEITAAHNEGNIENIKSQHTRDVNFAGHICVKQPRVDVFPRENNLSERGWGDSCVYGMSDYG